MKSAILEVNASKKVRGRTYIKWIIHEIYSDKNSFNKNGISWKEEYVIKNIESAKGMPICVEFLDWDKSEPFGHGESGVKDGEPLFEYSVVVGVTENAYVDTVEVNGESKRVLIGEGYIYNQRYPQFVQWLKSKMFDKDFPETSVEICATDGNDFIIYENGWVEKGRVPMDFDYSGDAILGIEPSDDSAVLLELNNKFNKEDDTMKDQVVELNNKLEAKINEINQLKNDLQAKDDKVTELNSLVETKTSELEGVTAELNTAKDTLQAKEQEIESITKEVNELRTFKKDAEDKDLVNELNAKLVSYTEEEKSVVKEKVETFSKTPSKEAIAEIINEINAEITKKVLESRKQNEIKEQNSKVEDIYSDVYEVNSELETDDLY